MEVCLRAVAKKALVLGQHTVKVHSHPTPTSISKGPVSLSTLIPHIHVIPTLFIHWLSVYGEGPCVYYGQRLPLMISDKTSPLIPT